jgi:replication initiation protein RepC
VLRNLARGQAAFGITERDLTVLQGLLGFHPHEALGNGADMVVFASNRALCERLNGMACSTMRRHLARLVEAGLLWRRDSPNGKRYARSSATGRIAYGLDLTPLHHRAAEIAEAAEAARAAEERIRTLRETVSLMRRDLAALAAFGRAEALATPGLWDQLEDAATLTARTLRRKLTADDLEALRTALTPLIEAGRRTVEAAATEVSGTNDIRSEQHHQRSDTESLDSEAGLQVTPPHPRPAPRPAARARSARSGRLPGRSGPCAENARDGDGDSPSPRRSNGHGSQGGAAGTNPGPIPDPTTRPPVSLAEVVALCPELGTFHPEPIRNWRDLHAAASQLHPALGISPSAWAEAQGAMGSEQASVVIAVLLERYPEIRSPGGYLRALSAQAARGAFCCASMVRALAARDRAA